MRRDALLLAGLAAVFFVLVSRRGQDLVGEALVAAGDWMERALDLLRDQEGFSPTPYADARGQSIGYGHFIRPGESFGVISLEQGGDLLRRDMMEAAAAVSSLVTEPLSEGQRAALVSFVYNVGTGNFASSTLLKKLNAADYVGAAEEFRRWVYSTAPNGEKVRLTALEQRREIERNTFLA